MEYNYEPTEERWIIVIVTVRGVEALRWAYSTRAEAEARLALVDPLYWPVLCRTIPAKESSE